MKKQLSLFMAACFMWVMMFQTSCIGSFNLTKKVYEWNTGMNKWVGELVFLVFVWIPVYSITLFIDAVILNLIEFWTGNNPMAMQPGEMEQQVVIGKDGNSYEITATMNRFDIVQLSGEKSGEAQSLIYDPASKSWSHEKGCEVNKVMQYSADGSLVSVYTADGRVATVPAGITDKSIASAMVMEQLESQMCMN